MNQVCKNCKWYEEYTGACFNGDSENCSEYLDMYDTCEQFEAKE